MPTFAVMVCAEIYGPVSSTLSVPWKSIWSPIANGACWRGSGGHVTPAAGVHDVCGGGGIMNVLQNWPSAGITNAGNGAGSDMQFGARGRFDCGHSGSSALLNGSVRGMHIG